MRFVRPRPWRRRTSRQAQPVRPLHNASPLSASESVSVAATVRGGVGSIPTCCFCCCDQKQARRESKQHEPTTNSIPRVVAAVVPGIPACTRSFRRLTSSMTHRYLCTSPDTGTWPSAARSLGRDRLSGGHVPALPPGRRVQQSVHSFSCLSHPALQ